MTFDASHVRAIRSRFGISMMDAKRACQIGEDRFDGDHELGARWILADQLAVNVRGGKEARALYNDEHARASKARAEEQQS